MAGELTPGSWEQVRVPAGISTAILSRQVLNLADPVRRKVHKGLELEVYFFASVNDGESWISQIPNIVATAWQGDVASTDEGGATLIDQATGEVSVSTANAGISGWLWVLRGK